MTTEYILGIDQIPKELRPDFAAFYAMKMVADLLPLIHKELIEEIERVIISGDEDTFYLAARIKSNVERFIVCGSIVRDLINADADFDSFIAKAEQH